MKLTLTALIIAVVLAAPAVAETFVAFISAGTVHSIETVMVTRTSAASTVVLIYTYLEVKKPSGTIYRAECRNALAQPCRDLSPGDGVYGTIWKDGAGRFWGEDVVFTHVAP